MYQCIALVCELLYVVVVKFRYDINSVLQSCQSNILYYVKCDRKTR